MENASYIQWNVPNWITIFLMATIGYLLFGFIAAAAKNFAAQRAASIAVAFLLPVAALHLLTNLAA